MPCPLVTTLHTPQLPWAERVLGSGERPDEDFVAVSQVAITPLIMVAPPEGGAKTVKELIETARAKPGSLNYSSAGLGSTTGIAGLLFKQTTKIDIVHLPFKGLPETHTAIIRASRAYLLARATVGIAAALEPLMV